MHSNNSELLPLRLVHIRSIIESLGLRIVEIARNTKHLPTPTLAARVDFSPEGEGWARCHGQGF